MPPLGNDLTGADPLEELLEEEEELLELELLEELLELPLKRRMGLPKDSPELRGLYPPRGALPLLKLMMLPFEEPLFNLGSPITRAEL